MYCFQYGCGDIGEQGVVFIATDADCIDGDVVVYCLLGAGIAVAMSCLADGQMDKKEITDSTTIEIESDCSNLNKLFSVL